MSEKSKSASDAVLEVVGDLQEWLTCAVERSPGCESSIMMLSRVKRWITVLKSAAPGMGTLGEVEPAVIAEIRDYLEGAASVETHSSTDNQSENGSRVVGMDLPPSPQMILMSFNAILDRHGTPQPKVDAGSEPGQVIGEVGCPGCGAVLQIDHGEDPGELGTLLIPPFPVIGAPSKGECEHGKCTYYQHWASGPVDEDLLKGQLSKALQRAESAERDLADARARWDNWRWTAEKGRRVEQDNSEQRQLIKNLQVELQQKQWVGATHAALMENQEKLVTERDAALADTEQARDDCREWKQLNILAEKQIDSLRDQLATAPAPPTTAQLLAEGRRLADSLPDLSATGADMRRRVGESVAAAPRAEAPTIRDLTPEQAERLENIHPDQWWRVLDVPPPCCQDCETRIQLCIDDPAHCPDWAAAHKRADS